MVKIEKISLSHPPLNEAIFEVKWKSSNLTPELKKDNQLVAGVFFSKIKDDYTFFEPLEASKFPVPPDGNDIWDGVPLYRFRTKENGWPLIQIGSGMLSVNSTSEYEWENFKKRCIDALEKFLEVYPVGDQIESINLSYINALDFDYSKEDILDFLKTKMGVDVSLPSLAVEASDIKTSPENFNIRFSFPSTKLIGNLNIFFGSGKVKENDALVWNNNFISKKGSIPKISELNDWLEQSHEKLEQWFFILIKDIKEKFK
jgi:uncharacterized protein (TIGR04255 family)